MGFGGEWEEVRDQFEGDWLITKVHGYTDAELHKTEPARLTFWTDDTADLECAGHSVTLDVQFGETLEGLPAVTFKGQRAPGRKRVTVSGVGLIRASKGKTLEGSLTIGGRARAFTAKWEG